MGYSPEQREVIIDQLDRSFQAMPKWAQTACKHASGAPRKHPQTGEPITSFREALTISADSTLETLLEDFEGNDDLLPPSGYPNPTNANQCN